MKVDIYNTDKKYNIIYADPAWKMKKIERKVRPNQKGFDYPTMELEDIKNLPVKDLADDNCVLFLWTTQSYLPKAFEVMESWGFKYQRTLTWDKMNGLCLFGFHNRTEFLLFGYKGKIEMYPKRKTIPTMLQYSSKKLRHSEKPKEIREIIEVFGENKIELFARQYADGWDRWGLEAPND